MLIDNAYARVILVSYVGSVCIWSMLIDSCMSYFFFFQAEDGIRDLVRSRGLGDVYKRQGRVVVMARYRQTRACDMTKTSGRAWRRGRARIRPVSYTHLTLPTSDLV